jgi:DNA-binding FadR family transcriptional regulator
VKIFDQVIDRVGAGIVSGELSGAHTIDQLVRSTGASRSVVREAATVLASKGLLRARKRIGFEVQPESDWNALDADVIHWTLATDRREAQVAALIEVRFAIEPEAAALAAERRTEEEASEILAIAGTMWASGTDGDAVAFLAADQLLHARILEASGNPMLRRMSGVVTEALADRPLAQPIDLKQVALHVDVARAIRLGNRDAAFDLMRTIIVQGRIV